MDEFTKALLDKPDSGFIPAEEDWFAPLIGDWEFDYSEPGERQLKGEWFFRKVLEGTAIEDIFICPSRDTRNETPQPDGEYGVAIRMYNPYKHCYDMTYVCERYTTRLTVRKIMDRIECYVKDRPDEKWCFSDITDNSFHWQNESRMRDGSVKIGCEVFAVRKTGP